MSHPFHHAQSTARRWKGVPEDYLALHSWFDSTKSGFAHFTHRAILHNSFGIFLAEQLFGVTITNSDGVQVPVRVIGEQHVREDLGWIPTIKDWLGPLQIMPWMRKGVAVATDGFVPDELQVVVVLSPEEAKRVYNGERLDTVSNQILMQLAERDHVME